MCKALSHDIVIGPCACWQERRQARLQAQPAGRGARRKRSPQPPLFGLVLAGGRSTRMQRDKAAIEYRPGESQLDAAVRLLAPRVSEHSCRCAPSSATMAHARAIRRSSIVATSRARLPASARHWANIPDAAWLVLACDLPFLDAQTLDTLIARA